MEYTTPTPIIVRVIQMVRYWLNLCGVIYVHISLHLQRTYMALGDPMPSPNDARQAVNSVEPMPLPAHEHRSVDQFAALNQLTRSLGAFAHSAELFDQVAHLIRETLDYPMVSLWLQEGDRLILHSVSGADSGVPVENWALAPWQAMTTGNSVILAEPASNPATAQSASLNPGRSSAVAAPLRWGGGARVGGALAVHSPGCNAFRPGDQAVLEILAALIAAALDRIRLLEPARRQDQQHWAAAIRGLGSAIWVFNACKQLCLIHLADQQLFANADIRLGQPLPSGKGYDELIALLDRAHHSGAGVHGVIAWPGGRTVFARIVVMERGGHAAIMRDVTGFKSLSQVTDEWIISMQDILRNPIAAVLLDGDLMERASPRTHSQRTEAA